jgi:hypothetical protein
MLTKRVLSIALAFGLLAGALGELPQAQAHSGRYRTYQGHKYHYDQRRNSWVDYQTGKILKGGLIGAGAGAGAGLLTGRNVGRTALVGAGVGAGVQATRYSQFMRRHPIVKTGAYGALAGTGVGAVTGDGRLGKKALWGAGIGTGIGALNHMR